MTDHFAEAESYLQKIDTLEPADAYVAVVAAQAHAQLAQIGPARDMVGLQRQLLESMLPTPPSKAEQVKAAMEEAQALARAMPGPEEQVKPAVEEPTEFGSIVEARWSSQPKEFRKLRWQNTPLKGKHYWESETGIVEVWSELTDVEVLRVGLGDEPNESYRKGFEFGMREMNTQIHLRHLEQLAESITSERKNALEKAIQAVEELAP